MDHMQNLINTSLAESFAADAERRWLFGHPYRVDRAPRAARTVGRRAAARSRRRVTARRPLRTA
jgi:hypothetical protein